MKGFILVTSVISAVLLTGISAIPFRDHGFLWSSLAVKRSLLSNVDTERSVDADDRCPKRPVFVIDSGGRTGNWIMYYISTWLVGRHLFLANKQVPYVHRDLRERVMDIFENTTSITLPVVEDIPGHCEVARGVDWRQTNAEAVSMYTLYNTEQLESMFGQFTGNIVLRRGAFFMDPIFKNFHEIRNKYIYRKAWIDYANQRLEEIKSAFVQQRGQDDSDKRITFVSVHVRRTDYIAYMKLNERRNEVGVDYFKAAMKYFRNNESKYGVPVFVVVSDEKEWVRQNLITAEEKDVFIAGSGDLHHATSDLALLSMCDHSIIDYGTFGLWGALYTRGHKVLVKYGRDQIYRFLQGNPKWHFVDVSENPIVVP